MNTECPCVLHMLIERFSTESKQHLRQLTHCMHESVFLCEFICSLTCGIPGKREIQALPVKCDNVGRTCTWVGTVSTLRQHMDTCEFAFVPCPNQCRDEPFMKRDLDNHLEEDCPNREHSCEHCGEKGTYSFITEVHYQSCQKKTLPCPNGCKVTMKRQHVEEHVATECELAVIPCKYQRLGCDVELEKRDIASHEEDDKLHLRMAIDTTVKLEQKVDELERDLKCFSEKTTNLEQNLKNATQESANLERNLEKALDNIARLEGKVATIKFTKYHDKKLQNEGMEFPISPNGYQMTVTVYVNGYATGKGSHISIFTHILNRKCEAIKWPLFGKLTFILLNQLGDNNHHQCHMTGHVTAANNAVHGAVWGKPKFIPHSKLGFDEDSNTQYLKDDTLYFRVLFEVPNNKPWLK